MCGIVGYTGPQDAAPILLAGLRRLEYRGYDSAGVATLDDSSRLTVRKKSGRVRMLEESLEQRARARYVRHGPHPMGHARAALRPQRAPPRRRRRRGRRRSQRRHREPCRPARGTRIRGVPVRLADRHRGRRAYDRAIIAIGARPVCRRPARPSSPRRDLRPGRRQPEVTRIDRRRAAGKPAGRGRGRGGALPRLRLIGHRATYRERRVLAGRRGRAAHPALVRDPPPRAGSDHAPHRPH